MICKKQWMAPSTAASLRCDLSPAPRISFRRPRADRTTAFGRPWGSRLRVCSVAPAAINDPRSTVARVATRFDPAFPRRRRDHTICRSINDRALGRIIPSQKAGSDLQDTSNIAGSHPGGTDSEAAGQVLRPRSQHHDRRAINRGNSKSPLARWVRSRSGGPTDRTSRDARITRSEIVVQDRVLFLCGRGGQTEVEVCPEKCSATDWQTRGSRRIF